MNVNTKRGPWLLCTALLLTPAAAAGGSTQSALVRSYFAQSNTSRTCGPADLEAYTSATFFPSGKEMYIWNAGALSYYTLQNQKAVRRWTATPVLPNQQVVGPVHQLKTPNTFIRWFMREHHLNALDVTNACGVLPRETRGGAFYQVKVRAASRGTLTPTGSVIGLRQVASDISDPRLYLTPN